uniref:DUF4032 domain-containing protein n=1 Tax=Aldersonia kunmingensis TaxID=408066 RepID=UPI000AEC4D69
HDCVDHVGTPIQAYCDLLEVRWLLSEHAGADVGDETALAALARHRHVPTDSAAKMGVAEAPTSAFRRIEPKSTSAASGDSALEGSDEAGHTRGGPTGPPPPG